MKFCLDSANEKARYLKACLKDDSLHDWTFQEERKVPTTDKFDFFFGTDILLNLLALNAPCTGMDILCVKNGFSLLKISAN